MKFATISKSLVMTLALLLASSAFAANKTNLTLNHPASVNGTTLKAGDYKLEWEGAGPDVEVSIKQGKNVVAKVPARIVQLNSASQNDAAVIKNNADGTSTLDAIRLEGKKYGLDFGEEADGMQTGSTK